MRALCQELWTPIGPDDVAYWTAEAEAFAIPKAIAPQTQPEFPLTIQQAWASAAGVSWTDLARCFKWKSEQPGGREKHATAFGIIRSYATWLGDRAYVQRGIDVRTQYPLIVHGCFAANLDNVEAWLGGTLVREQFESIQRGSSREPRLLLFIPEGQLLFSRELEFARRGNLSYLVRFFEMANSMGIGLIANFQAPSKTSAHVLANSATVIVLRQSSLTEATCCAELLGLSEEAIPELMTLPPWVAIVKTPGWEAPVAVQVPYVDLGPPLTPEQVEERFKQDYARIRSQMKFAKPDDSVEPIDWQAIAISKSAGAGKPQRAAAPLLQDHYRFLHDVHEHESGLKARYDRLGWSVEKGNRRLAELKAAGCILVRRESSPSAAGGRPRLSVRLTPFGLETLRAYESHSTPSQTPA